MTIIEERRGNTTILKLQGRLDTASVHDADQSLTATIDKGARQLVLDMSGLEYVSSAGLRLLLTTAKRLQQSQGRMVLAAPSDQAGQILEMAGFSNIISVFAATDEAVGSFEPVAALAAAADDRMKPLGFAEEIFLLALDEKQGTVRSMPGFTLDYVLAGALLMDLALLDRIDSDLSVLTVTSSKRTGDPLLDDTILEFGIQDPKTPQPISFWLNALAERSGYIQKRVLDGLVRKGILKEEDRRILWVFAVRRYPIADNRDVKEVRTRLRELILGDELPDPRDVVLISLGMACHLLEDLFTSEEYERVAPRIAALARLDLIGQAMTKAISDIDQSIAQAIVAMGQ
jgi:golgi phosphoprotein 3